MNGLFIPRDLVLHTLARGRPQPVTTAALFAGRRVVLVGLPGAFTPTCTSAHVPRYVELLQPLRAAGVDDVVIVSVNDAFVMDAWQTSLQAGALTFVADGNAELTRALDMVLDKRDLGFGLRSRRYAAVVDDGVVTHAFVEPDVAGDPYEVSDADTVLSALSPGARIPADITMLTRDGCAFCHAAVAALDDAGLAHEAIPASRRTLRAIAGSESTPQVFVDGEHLGGHDALVAWLDVSRDPAVACGL